MRFDNLFSRADIDVVQTILGRGVVRLVTALDPNLAVPERLRTILKDLYAPSSLLRSRKSRSLLFDLLKPVEAQRLFTLLSLRASCGDVYAELKSLRIAEGSERERILFSYFDISAPTLSVVTKPDTVGTLGCEYGLFTHQRSAVHRIEELFRSGEKRVLLHMPTGSGKTRTAMNIVSTHLRCTEPTLVIWLAYSEELCSQAADEFAKAWRCLGNRELSVTRMYGSHSIAVDEIPIDGLIVAGLSKMYSSILQSLQFVNSLAARTSLVVMDEAHQAVAETYKLVLDSLVLPYPQTALLGLSATPGRTWADVDADRTLADFFRRRKVTLSVKGYSTAIDYLIAEGYLANPSFNSLFYTPGFEVTSDDLERVSQNVDIPKDIVDRLALDDQRNLCIFAEIERLVTVHRRILLFAASVEHAKMMASLLRARSIEAYSVTSDTSREERERIISAYRSNDANTIVLSNYGVLTTGFDAPMTSVAVIARPTKSLVLYSQMVGRAIRGPKAGGNAHALISTVIDSALPGFGKLAEAFLNWEDVWED